jgi:hypothetical protein
MVKFLKSITLTLAAVAAMAFGTSAFAQNATKQNNATVQGKNVGKGMMINREKITAQKIAFFTEELNLTSDEAVKFWPVYNSCWKEKMEAKRATHQSLKALSQAAKDANSSDSDVRNLADIYHKNYEKELELVSEHFAEYQKVLPIKKAALVTATEEKFKNNLIMQLRGKGYQQRKMNQINHMGHGQQMQKSNNK